MCWDPSKRQKKWRNLPMDDQLWAKMPALHVPVHLVLTWFPDLAAVPDRKVIAWLARQASGAASEELSGLAEPEKYKAKVCALNLSLAELLHKLPGLKGSKRHLKQKGWSPKVQRPVLGEVGGLRGHGESDLLAALQRVLLTQRGS